MEGMPHLFQQRLKSELYARYRLDSQVEIVSLLRSLQDARSQLVLHFSESGYILSRVLDVTPPRLTLDLGPDKAANDALIASNQAVAETNLQQVSIQFQLSGFHRVNLPDGPALEALLPDCMLRLQRRESFRVPTPVMQPIMLFIPQQDRCPRDMRMRIADISTGGVAAVCDGNEFRPESGMVLRECQIALPEVGLLVADIEVRHVMPLREGNDSQLQCGMRFLALPPQMSNFVQRFVMQVERELRKVR